LVGKSHWLSAAALLATAHASPRTATVPFIERIPQSVDLVLFVGCDHRFAVSACLLQPIGGELFADFLQTGLQRRPRRQHFHAVRLELVEIPTTLVLPHFPTALFRRGGRLEPRVLCRVCGG